MGCHSTNSACCAEFPDYAPPAEDGSRRHSAVDTYAVGLAVAYLGGFPSDCGAATALSRVIAGEKAS